MNNNPLVSVIVPCYNVQKYIEKLTMSLVEQDYKNIEIILVDDGSPDDCPRIIDELAQRDERIVAVHKENGGVSTARNAGLERAKGEYLMFVDGDDWVDKDYVSYFLNLIKRSKCDIAMNNNYYSVYSQKEDGKAHIVKAEKAIEWIYTGEISEAVWNKIYRKEFLEKNDLHFSLDIWYGEGMLFNIHCLQYVDKVAVGNKKVYHQTFNPDSAMRNFNLESNLCGIRSLERQKALWTKVTPEIEKEWEYHRYRFNRSIITGLVRIDAVKENQEIYDQCVRDMRKNFMIPLSQEKSLKGKISWLLYMIDPARMSKRNADNYRKMIEEKRKQG